MNADYEQPLATKQIRKLLLNVGFPPNIYGYDYILYLGETKAQHRVYSVEEMRELLMK